MAASRGSPTALRMAKSGDGNSLVPSIASRTSKRTLSATEVGGSSRFSTTSPRRPSPLSRENSYQDSSEPPSRPQTPKARRRMSQYPDGDFRNSSAADLATLKSDVMCSWLHQQQIEKGWSSTSPDEGVILKKARDNYMCCPKQLQAEEDGLFAAISKLKVKVSAHNKWQE